MVRNSTSKPLANKATVANKPLAKIVVTDSKVLDTGDDYLKLDSGRLEISIPAPMNPAPPSETRKGHMFYTTHGVKDFVGADGLANGHYIAINWCFNADRIGNLPK